MKHSLKTRSGLWIARAPATVDETTLRAMIANGYMTSALWNRLSRELRERVRDESELCQELRGLEGARVEALHCGERSRFQVGISTGWRPCHLRLHNARSMAGEAIRRGTVSDVRVVRNARP